MFEKARLKLTAWYLIIIMTISLLFSFAIYARVNNEFNRFEHIQQTIRKDLERDTFMILRSNQPRSFIKIDLQEIQAARTRFLLTLGLINMMILGVAGTAGYFLAGRTLRPIKEMVDEQNRFITDASHELRTPITSLRSEIEVALRNKQLTLAEAKKLLQSNLEETINLQVLSDNLLELSQIGKPQSKQNITNVSLQESIESAIKNLSGLSKKKNITIETNTKEVTIQGIPEKLTELFVILLDNAIKYSPQGETITILANKNNEKAHIEIKDNGIGISQEDLPYIFDRFYRGTPSRSKIKIPGHGLGLAIAKEIVNAHNGTIAYASKPGKGTVVTLEFSALFKY